MKILVVDDEPDLVATLSDYLEQAGYGTVGAHDARSALAAFDREAPALVILDLGLPDRDGIQVAQEIRRRSSVPLIVLTARSHQADRIIGLEAGADDYVTKPVSPREVVLRVQAVLRRASGEATAEEVVSVGDLRIDLAGRVVEKGGQAIELTPTEFDLLAFLVRRPNRAFTRMQLLEGVQGHTTPALARNIDTHVMNLRRKVEADPAEPRLLLTVYGVGYRLALPMRGT